MNKVTSKELTEFYRTQIERRLKRKVSLTDAEQHLMAFGEAILGLALTGKEVGIVNLGVFRLQRMAGLKARGMFAGTNRDTPARRILRFRAAARAKNL